MRMKNLVIILFGLYSITSCSQISNNLKEKFEDYFLIGSTINQEDYKIIDQDKKAIDIVIKDFNALLHRSFLRLS